MTAFKPWECRAGAGFVKGTELTGYKVVVVDADLGRVEAEYDGQPAYLDVDVGSWLFGPPRDVAGRSRGADRRNGEKGVVEAVRRMSVTDKDLTGDAASEEEDFGTRRARTVDVVNPQ